MSNISMENNMEQPCKHEIIFRNEQTRICIFCRKEIKEEKQMPFDYFSTYSGARIYMDRMNIEDFPIEDIAHQLSLVNRFSGATKVHYSVAQHSLLIFDHCPKHLQLTALVHDMSDIVMGDLNSPLKHHHLMKQFLKLETEIQDRFCHKFGLAPFTLWPEGDIKEFKKWDLAAQCAEARCLTNLTWHLEFEENKLITEEIRPLPPIVIERRFLMELRSLISIPGYAPTQDH